MLFLRRLFTLVMIIASTASTTIGQAPSANPELTATTQTPQGAARAFLEACRSSRYDEAALLLDLANVPEASRTEAGPRLARKLKVVLDQTLWVDLDALSTDPSGELDDGLPPDFERVGAIEATRGGRAEIRLQRSAADGVWRFSERTVSRVPGLYEEFGYGRLGDYLPNVLSETRFFDVQLWQWIGIVVLAAAAQLAAWALVACAEFVLKPLAARSATDVDDELVRLGRQPVRLALAVLLFSASAHHLHLAVPAQRVLDGSVTGVAFLAVAWLMVRAVTVFGRVLRSRFARTGRTSALAVVPLVEKTAKFALLAMGLIAVLQHLGIDATGLIAGLGVGGLALALAAQKTVENLFGGVSLVTDQPIRVGDFCRFGDKLGVVEDIGMRSTRVRTLDRTLLTIPNAEFAQMQLENFAARDKIRFYTVLGLRYETTADQLRWVLTEIRRLLRTHPKVDPSPARIRFVGYGDYSLNLEIFSFVTTRDFDEYLAIQEDLLLRIMDVVGASGTGFAFPSNTTYLARDSGNDDERTRAAELRVAEWRRDGRLPFPDFGPDAADELASKLDYPPNGSAWT